MGPLDELKAALAKMEEDGFPFQVTAKDPADAELARKIQDAINKYWEETVYKPILNRMLYGDGEPEIEWPPR